MYCMWKDNSGLLVAAARSCWSTYFGNSDSDDNDDDVDEKDDDDEKNDGDKKNGEKLPLRIFPNLQQDQHFPTQS